MPTCKWNAVSQHLASTQPWRAALLSSLLCTHGQELDHLHWCFCVLEVVVFPSQVLSTSREVRLLLFSEPPLPPWQAFYLELAPRSKSYILCVCVCDPKDLPVNQALPVVPDAYTDQAAAVCSPRRTVMLTQTFGSQHWYKFFVMLGKSSELFSVIINQIHLVTTSYITCFILRTFFVDRFIKKTTLDVLLQNNCDTLCTLNIMTFLYSLCYLAALCRIWAA